MTRPVFVLTGDSITQDGGNASMTGWATLLQRDWLRSVDIINRGLSGYNTKWFIQYALPEVLEEMQTRFKPALITLWLGANDAALVDGSSKQQHIPLDEYSANLRHILTEYQRVAPSAKILLITPAVIDDDHRRRFQQLHEGFSEPLDRKNHVTVQYATACAEVGASISGIKVLDLHSVLTETYEEEARHRLLSDGLHFTPEGNQVLYELIKQAMTELLPAETVATWQFPDHKDIARWEAEKKST
ncbi:hypothetical protein Poli38472_012935 [Pythium oligandrum]|uniref:SGNH hydrolase-type esterase domain-containing protein n=1 Tax=Pythium oligandrum TaxID=41045 RepID=A0A8K1CL19_PYTOL|nr:hypothetical protein Poli38472_012935 [Pythium oligandrum]|eukprot:TMW64313.1 hypothetical protein Poli38472_012935 [Pythium oligandrum]